MKLKEIFNRYQWGGRYLSNGTIQSIQRLNQEELIKQPTRTEIINFSIHALGLTHGNYLEIGVRNPDDHFNHVVIKNKTSVDPGLEFKENPVNFKMSSDESFNWYSKNSEKKQLPLFDVIFIDGLHTAEQCFRDIENSLKFLHPDGLVFIHDCNPPSEWHAREDYYFDLSPAKNFWNGTTWKAFIKARKISGVYSCCIDSDWGIGVISKTIPFKFSEKTVFNEFYSFSIFNENRSDSLNLIEFSTFQHYIEQYNDARNKL